MGKIHKYIFIGIIILEMLFISAVVIRDLHYSQQIDISGDQMDTIDSGFMKDDIVLQRGIYGVAVNYSTAENMTAQILSKTQIISGGWKPKRPIYGD